MRVDELAELASESSAEESFGTYRTQSLSSTSTQDSEAKYTIKSYILLTLIVCFNIDIYRNLAARKLQELTYMDIIPTVLLVALPMQYMQMMMGAYTEKNMTFLKYMCPIIRGLGYSMTISIALRSVPHVVEASDSLAYFIKCFQKKLPWMTCPQELSSVCWNNEECTRFECLSSSIQTSSHIFWNRTFIMQNVEEQVLKGLHYKRFILIIITWFVLYLVYLLSSPVQRLRANAVLFVIFVIHLIVAFTFVPPMCTQIFSSSATDIFSSLATPQKYIISGSQYIIILRLGTGYHMVAGSRHSLSHYTTALCILIELTTFLFIGMVTWSFNKSLSCIAKLANLGKMYPSHIIVSREEFVEYTIILHAICQLVVPQLWATLFLLANISQSLNIAMVSTMIVEYVIADVHRILVKQYHKYLLAIYTLAGCIVSILYTMVGLHTYTQTYMLHVLDMVDLVNLFILSFFTFWVYGVSQLKDDIQFLFGQPPLKIWQFFCYFSPALLLIFAVQKINEAMVLPKNYVIFLTFLIIESPLFIFGIIECFKYIRKKQLVSLFQPLEQWGPRNRDMRKQRYLYNPRNELKSRRRYDICNHVCLLNTTFLATIKKEEKKIQAHIVTEQDSSITGHAMQDA